MARAKKASDYGLPYVSRDIGRTVAINVSTETDAIGDLASVVYKNARDVARDHIRTGDFYNSLHYGPVRRKDRKHGVHDWEIWSDDEDGYKIEVGAYTEVNGWDKKQFIPGQYIFQQAIARTPGKWVKTRSV